MAAGAVPDEMRTRAAREWQSESESESERGARMAAPRGEEGNAPAAILGTAA
jgi:hypothetical protein